MSLKALIEQGYFDPPKHYELDLDVLTPDDMRRIANSDEFRVASIKDDCIYEFRKKFDGQYGVYPLPVSLTQTGTMANRSVENMIALFGCVTTYKTTIFKEVKCNNQNISLKNKWLGRLFGTKSPQRSTSEK